jgi:hypothetical protein
VDTTDHGLLDQIMCPLFAIHPVATFGINTLTQLSRQAFGELLLELCGILGDEVDQAAW